MLLIVAFNAPIAAMAGFVQLSVGLGTGIGAPTAFLIGAGILLLFATGFVAMAKHMANPGAFYTLILAGLGKRAGLAGAFVAMAAYLLLCAGSYPYMGIVTAEFCERMTGDSILSAQAWSLIFLVLITVIGLFRVDVSMRLLGLLVLLEIAVVVLWEGAILLQGGAEGYSLASYSPELMSHGAPGLGILFAMLTMIGIEAGACYSSETRNPDVTVGRATFLAIVFLGVFYSIGTWCYIISQGPSLVVERATTDPVGSFFDSVQHYLGAIFVPIASLILVTSQMAALNSVQGSAARYFFALSREGVLPHQLGRVHSRLQSPYIAVLLVSAISLLILLAIRYFGINPVSAYAGLTGMGIYFLLPLMIATCLAIARYFQTYPEIPVNMWRQRFAPLLAAAALATLFLFTSENLEIIVGSRTMVWVSYCAVIGIPVAGWLIAEILRRTNPGRYAAIGCEERLP